MLQQVTVGRWSLDAYEGVAPAAGAGAGACAMAIAAAPAIARIAMDADVNVDFIIFNYLPSRCFDSRERRGLQFSLMTGMLITSGREVCKRGVDRRDEGARGAYAELGNEPRRC